MKGDMATIWGEEEGVGEGAEGERQIKNNVQRHVCDGTCHNMYVVTCMTYVCLKLSNLC